MSPVIFSKMITCIYLYLDGQETSAIVSSVGNFSPTNNIKNNTNKLFYLKLKI